MRDVFFFITIQADPTGHPTKVSAAPSATDLLSSLSHLSGTVICILSIPLFNFSFSISIDSSVHHSKDKMALESSLPLSSPRAPTARNDESAPATSQPAIDQQQAYTGNETPASRRRASKRVETIDWSYRRQHPLAACLPPLLYISIFIYGLDTTIAADVQGAVVENFGHVEQLAWIGAGFPLGSVSVILLNGVLYNNFNMKWMFAASLVVFEAGSALCGAAPNMAALIVGRVLAGAGGSGAFLGCLNYFTSPSPLLRNGVSISPKPASAGALAPCSAR